MQQLCKPSGGNTISDMLKTRKARQLLLAATMLGITYIIIPHVKILDSGSGQGPWINRHDFLTP